MLGSDVTNGIQVKFDLACFHPVLTIYYVGSKLHFKPHIYIVVSITDRKRWRYTGLLIGELRLHNIAIGI